MANSSKAKASIWHGYLMAGERSSPVLQDERLDTGNPKTFYMFNLKRGEILEYAREVVERKLRELKPDESSFIAELDAGYKKARRNFRDRGATIRNITERVVTAVQKEKDYGEDNAISGFTVDDADVWTDAEEA